jgi:two-component system, response regulator / RNA-binding antiterminator
MLRFLGKPAVTVRPMAKGLKVMLVVTGDEDATDFEGFLAEAGHRVVGRCGEDDDFVVHASTCRPDVVVIDAVSPRAGLLAKIEGLRRAAPRPIALFCDAGNSDEITAAVGAGVSALIPVRATRERLISAIEVALAQFGETNRLLQERDRATTALAERKLIERAKGIIMKQRGLDEDAAYKFMRQAAMNKNLRLGA